MKPRAVVFLHLFDGQSFVAEFRKLDKLFLNLLKTFLTLSVSDLRLRSSRAAEAMLFVQSLNIGDLRPQAGNLFAKNFQMIHRPLG